MFNVIWPVLYKYNYNLNDKGIVEPTKRGNLSQHQINKRSKLKNWKSESNENKKKFYAVLYNTKLHYTVFLCMYMWEDKLYGNTGLLLFLFFKGKNKDKNKEKWGTFIT